MAITGDHGALTIPFVGFPTIRNSGFALLTGAEGRNGVSVRLAAALAELRWRIGAVPSAVFEHRRRRWLEPAEAAREAGAALAAEDALDIALSRQGWLAAFAFGVALAASLSAYLAAPVARTKRSRPHRRLTDLHDKKSA